MEQYIAQLYKRFLKKKSSQHLKWWIQLHTSYERRN